MNSAHLIKQIEDTSIQDCLSKIEDACRHIRSCVISARPERQLETALSAINWASRIKRISIGLNSDQRSCSLIGKTEEDFIEIVNQCANLERLIDALRWAACPDSGLWCSNLPSYDEFLNGRL